MSGFDPSPSEFRGVYLSEKCPEEAWLQLGTFLPALSLRLRSRKEEPMPTQPTIARIWRGRTRPEIADAYEAYIRAEGIPPLEKTALGVQLFREDREQESWFTTISYWSTSNR